MPLSSRLDRASGAVARRRLLADKTNGHALLLQDGLGANDALAPLRVTMVRSERHRRRDAGHADGAGALGAGKPWQVDGAASETDALAGGGVDRRALGVLRP